MSEISSRLELANRIAVEAGKLTLQHFGSTSLEVQKKGDGSPLTIADQQAETFLRNEIAKAFPDDAIVGEEYGETEGTSHWQWILDPIDGTKSFISGVPLYGTMVAVAEKASASEAAPDNDFLRSVIGSVYLPGIEEGIFASTGQGAWHFRGDGDPVRASVSQTASLAEAVLVTSQVETFNERGAADTYRDLAEAAWFCRTWGDVYGYLLVATGRVDIMVDPELNVWDAAAVQPIIQEAGGVFSDWKGNPRIDAGESIGANPVLHQHALEILSKAS